MQSARLRILAGMVVLGGLTAGAQAGGNWSVGVGIGVPGPGYYRPYPGYYSPYYYRPYPVVVPAPVYYSPPPIVVEQRPVYVQPAPSIAPAPPAPEQAPPPRNLSFQTTSAVANSSEVNRHLQMLASNDESARLDSVAQLGKLQDARAIDPLAATLAGDRSPSVRDAAARALGLIGSVKGLPALQHAAQADADRDVRRSAQFAAEVIQSRR